MLIGQLHNDLLQQGVNKNDHVICLISGLLAEGAHFSWELVEKITAFDFDATHVRLMIRKNAKRSGLWRKNEAGAYETID